MVTYGAAATTYRLLSQQGVVDMRFSQPAGLRVIGNSGMLISSICNRSYDLVSSSYMPSPVLLPSHSVK